jgi:aryl-alcohol dehydrogenase-like predicted oxidoreductase
LKIGLGSAQFGLDYGVSNHNGKTPPAEVAAILQMAAAQGIRVIDTAPLYGDSEASLGQAQAGAGLFRLITKTPAFHGRPVTAADLDHMRATFARSLQQLGTASAYGLLVHHADDLLATGGEALFEAASALKREGRVQKIGVSVYTGQEIDAILARFPVDLVQLPINILDQRLIVSGHLARLKSAGVEICARSAFLQGLLLMAPADLPAHFEPVRDHLDNLHRYLTQTGLTPLEGALGFVLALPEIDVVLCGVNDRRQLAEICAVAAKQIDPSPLRRFAFGDAAIVDPTRWPPAKH